MKRLLPVLLLAFASSLFFTRTTLSPSRCSWSPAAAATTTSNQKLILAEGISARANVEFTVVHEEGPAGKSDKTHKISIYEKDDWAKGYDVVLHNECFGAVTDVAVRRAHRRRPTSMACPP